MATPYTAMLNIEPQRLELVEPTGFAYGISKRHGETEFDAAARHLLTRVGLVPVGEWTGVLAAVRATATWRVEVVEHPQRCATCIHGCSCSEDDPDAGCGHYGCWGPKSAPECPFVTLTRSL